MPLPSSENENNTDLLLDSIVYLGACRQAQYRGASLDIVGLCDIGHVSIMPQDLNAWTFVFALPFSRGLSFALTVKMTSTTRDVSGWSSFTFEFKETDPTKMPSPLHVKPLASLGTANQQVPILRAPGSKHTVIAICGPKLITASPEAYKITVEINGKPRDVGGFAFCFQDPPLLLEPEKRAIMSMPGSAGALRWQMGCPKCLDKVTFVAFLKNSNFKVRDNDILLRDAPEIWKCTCGKAEFETKYIKKSVDDIFRQFGRRGGVGDLIPLYQRGAISTIAIDFQQLLNSNPSEESVQQFLEEHPIFWSFLTPLQILHKPTVLTRQRADFGILTTSKILYLVEIEKPQTVLVKKNGGLHSELQAGIDQIRDWRSAVQDHRDAFLSELGFERKNVDDIRYVVLAGMASKTDQAGLTKIRRDRAQDAQIICFDELTSFLMNLASELTLL